MRNIGTIFAFTFRDAVRKKAFAVSTIIILALILILCALPRLIEMVGTGDDDQTVTAETTYTAYLIDADNRLPDALAALTVAFPDTAFIQKSAADLETLKAQAAEDGTVSVVVIDEEAGTPAVTVITKDVMNGLSGSAVGEVLTQVYVTSALQAAGLDADTIALSQTQLPVHNEIAGNMDLTGFALGLVLTMLMFFAIYYYGYGVSMSIATEKTSRVMETLVVSAKPSHLLIGKCLAMGALGLLQFTVILLFAAGCYQVLIPEGFTLMGMPLSLSALTLPAALLILVYFLLGYSLYAVMNAVCGASVSKIEDLNAAMMPVMLIAMVSFYLGYISAATATDGLLQRVAMYLPFSSPFIVPFKLLNNDIAALDVVISIALLVASIVVVTLVSIRIYAASVLHYGKKLKLSELYKARV